MEKLKNTRLVKIDPQKELFRWGPIDGKVIYPDFWWGGLFAFGKKHYGWPDALTLFSKGRFTFISDYADLRLAGRKNFEKYILPDKKFHKNYEHWQNTLKYFSDFYEEARRKNLKKISDKDILIKFRQFKKLYTRFWENGLLPEISGFGAEEILSQEIGKKIKNNNEFHFVLEQLSAPEDFSFYQQEEIDLFSLKSIKDKKLLDEKLKAHREKYFWLFNSYHHTKVLPIGYFQKILNSYSEKEARRKIKIIKKLKEESFRHKEETVGRFHLPQKLLKIARRIAFCIWWQDQRKSYIFRANHIIDLFLKEAARRYLMNFDDLQYYTVDDVEYLLAKQKKLKTQTVLLRKERFLVVYDSKILKRRYIKGIQAERIFKPYINQKIAKNTNEFKGLVVNRGLVRGNVKIIHSPTEIKKMKKRDILVASMTSPDYIIALRKASAVITDEGGMTCHAAIVSRELKIPGIVGTKIATHVLKDGDIVEVDANNGVIRIIK